MQGPPIAAVKEQMVTIGVISDVHGNLHALEAVLDVLDADLILCAGDLIGYGAFPNEVVDLVRQKGILCVRGNHDDAALHNEFGWFNPYAAEAGRWCARSLDGPQRSFLEGLPVRLGYQDVAVFHGSPARPLREYVTPGIPLAHLKEHLEASAARVLVLGHTHVPFATHVNGGLVANPGSVGQPRDGDERASYGVLDTENLSFTVHRVPYDVEAAAKAITEVGLPSILAERLFVGR